MRAAVIREHGGTEVIAVEEVADPEPGPWDVLVDVHAAALNHLDIWVRQGGRLELPWPHVIGSDAAGVVAAMGERAHGWRVGQEVVISPGISCGCCPQCMAGEQSQCEDFGIVGMHRWGVFAERAAVPGSCLAPKPQHLGFQGAAALGVAYTTAWRMLFTRAQLRPGETVLIHGVGGGVALAALQMAVPAGARVIVTSSSEEKLARARELGAHETINYRAVDDVAAALRDLTGGRGADVAFDTVGAATWPVDFAAVRRGGRIVLCGVTTGAEAPTDLRALYWNQLTVLGSTYGSQRDVDGMLRTVANAGIRPVIDSVFPLDGIVAAAERMEAGEQFGKIVLEIP